MSEGQLTMLRMTIDVAIAREVGVLSNAQA
jgi:hypothetical protein